LPKETSIYFRNWLRLSIMHLQARIKRAIKPIFFSSELLPRTVHFGPGRGLSILLSRRNGLQKELGLYETELWSVFRRETVDARTIYDIGAADGFTALVFAKLNQSASIIAFEPDPESLNLLRRNLELNPDLAGRVKVMPQSVGEPEPTFANGAIHHIQIDDAVETGKVIAPDLVKIDVEGSELLVLRGMREVLDHYRPVLILETHSADLEEDCISFLASSGYKTSIIKNAPWRILWPEYRPIDHNQWLVARPRVSGESPGDRLMPLSIAWLGPMPGDDGGVAGVARDILTGLLRGGHQVHCYIAASEQTLPPRLTEYTALEVHWSGSKWQWGRWYSRNSLLAFLTSTISRALGMRRLGRQVLRDHHLHTFDVIYQFSNIEIFSLRRHMAQLPPLVLHPETHIQGELRWLKNEAGLRTLCEPRHRSLAVLVALSLRSQVQRRDIKRASRVICISSRFRDHLVADYGLAKEKARVIPNPIDLGSFVPAAKPDASPIRMLFIGRISVRKGIERLVTLSHRLDDLTGTVELEVIGGPTLWSDYRKLLEDLNHRIAKYSGHLGAAQLRKRLSSADLLIQPSLFEPFGLTVGEALASGVPVVVTEEVGAGEGVSSKCCERIPPGDDDAFEKAVRRTVARLRNGDGPTIRALARSEAKRLFDPELVSAAVAEVLAEAARE
jgi:glycosyltransferase involved in cell wall biosynthesis